MYLKKLDIASVNKLFIHIFLRICLHTLIHLHVFLITLLCFAQLFSKFHIQMDMYIS